ncbi:MAG TPA: hypothetical protein VHC22_34065 [Pirellulales bacterium]|nr:hypothetical protein [Pirellulales bacterium]
MTQRFQFSLKRLLLVVLFVAFAAALGARAMRTPFPEAIYIWTLAGAMVGAAWGIFMTAEN